MSTQPATGLWIVPRRGKRARYTQRNWVVSDSAFTTPFGRRRRRPHAPQALSSLSNTTPQVGYRVPVATPMGGN